VDGDDLDQLKFAFMEPIELARARSNLHALGRHLVAGLRRLLNPTNVIWLSFAVLTTAAGGVLIKYVEVISENISISSIIYMAILYPDNDQTFYADNTPVLYVKPDDNAQSLWVIIKAKPDNLPVIILSNVHQGDCIATFFPDSQIEAKYPLSWRDGERCPSRCCRAPAPSYHQNDRKTRFLSRFRRSTFGCCIY